MQITGSNGIDSIVQEVNVNLSSLDVISGGYLDLGKIIDTTNMAAGATVFSPLLTNVQWVRNIIFNTQTDQQYDIQIWYYDSLGNQLGAASPIQNIAGPGASSWSAKNLSGNLALLGYSAKFAIKNSSASPNTVATVKVQLLGM